MPDLDFYLDPHQMLLTHLNIPDIFFHQQIHALSPVKLTKMLKKLNLSMLKKLRKKIMDPSLYPVQHQKLMQSPLGRDQGRF